MSVYRIHGEAAPGAAADVGSQLAVVDIRVDGWLVTYTLAMRVEGASLSAAGGYANVELTFGSASTSTSNDIRQSIGMVQVGNNGAAAPTGTGASQVAVSGIRVKVFQGDRVYLFGAGSVASMTVAGTAYLYVDDNAAEDARSAIARR